MDVYGIVTEYNPFHNGHKYQIEQIKKENPRAMIMVILSGFFCQRGEPALLIPQKRAAMAMANGVDLVLQLPVYASTGSAEIFASTALKSLAATGLKLRLVFGAETDALPDLLKIAGFLIEEESSMWKFIEGELKNGISYAGARELFIADRLGPDKAALLRGPNQILAIEYLKAIQKYHLKIEPKLIKRSGSSYLDEQILPDQAASALAIRELLFSQGISRLSTIQTLKSQMPDNALAILLTELQKGAWQSFEKMKNYYYLCLENCREPETRYLNKDLYQRLAQALRFQKDFYLPLQELMQKVMTRQFPLTRVRRALTNLLLNIREMPDYEPAYLHVLGFTRNGRYLLKQIQKRSRLPVIHNFSELSAILDPSDLWQEKLELAASRIWLNSAEQPINQLFDSPLIMR